MAAQPARRPQRAAAIGFVALCATSEVPDEAKLREVEPYAYLGERLAVCTAGSKTGAAGATDRHRAGRVHFNVRTPANYDATYGHPLLFV